MTKKKPTPAVVRSAKSLLEQLGYTVNKRRPDPKIGDVIRFDGMDVLITFHQTEAHTKYDPWEYGGVEVSVGTYENLSTEPMWIDRDEWAKDDGQYEVIGHINLTKFTKKH